MAEKTIATMTESELRSLIAEVVDERVPVEQSFRLPADYDEANDPALQGLFEGPEDLSENVKKYVREGIENKFKGKS